MSKERMLAPPISTVGTMIRTMPATKRDCGLILLLYLPLFLRLGTPGKDAIHEVDSDVACVEFVPARSAFLRSSFLVHHLPSLAFLQSRPQGPPPPKPKTPRACAPKPMPQPSSGQ